MAVPHQRGLLQRVRRGTGHHGLHLPLRRGAPRLQILRSPRHADIVLITGPLTARVKDKVLRVWNEIPEPKVTVAVGICPISGGVFREGYSIEGPVDRYLPIDVNVPGCPPRPQAIMEGVLEAVAIWQERMEG